MSTISIIGSGGMAAAIGGLAVKAGHTVEVMGRDTVKARLLAEQLGPGTRTGSFGAAPAGDIAGDDAQAKARVSAFIESLGLRPMDTGQLPMARSLEHACLLSLGLLAHAVKHTKFSIGISLLG
ncbi:MAG: oxidoreductase [Novosphingobium sp.]|nr:oxidoreductase [Novosphingobium sp.]